MAETVECPACGWTGPEADLERVRDGQQCPVCAEVLGFGP